MTRLSFDLDPQLTTSTLFVKNLNLCQVRLKNDRRFPWLILIPQRPNLIEIFDLTLEDQHLLWSEITTTAQHMHKAFQAHG